MGIFQDIANAITGNDILMMEISRDEHGGISVSHSIDGIPLDSVNVMKYDCMGDKYNHPHKDVVVTIDNFSNKES
jgi:hypothetical protein